MCGEVMVLILPGTSRCMPLVATTTSCIHGEQAFVAAVEEWRQGKSANNSEGGPIKRSSQELAKSLACYL